MKIQLSTDGETDRLYVFPDEMFPRPANALAGPLKDRNAAAWWIVHKLEANLSAQKQEQWSRALVTAGGIDANPFQLIGLLGMIQNRLAEALIERCSPGVRDQWGNRHEEIAPQYPITEAKPRVRKAKKIRERATP